MFSLLFLLFKQATENKVDVLRSGCGKSKIITMCQIYLLVDAFITDNDAMGAVDSGVNF